MFRACANKSAMVCSAREDVRDRALTTIPELGRFGDVDIVQPDAGSSDDDEILRRFEVGPSTLVAERMINAWAPAKASLNSDGESPKRMSTSCRRRATLEDRSRQSLRLPIHEPQGHLSLSPLRLWEFEGASARVDKIGESHQSSARSASPNAELSRK